MVDQNQVKSPNTLFRARSWYMLIVLVFAVLLVRLFYLQVIRHNYYKTAALQGQLKQYEIAPERGAIEAHDGDRLVSIVLNEERYTVIADPKIIDDPQESAEKLTKIIGGSVSTYEKAMKADTRYSVLKKKVSTAQKRAIDELELKGVVLKKQPVRVYPQGTMAAQILGFVNDEGRGNYGLEQYMDSTLRGKPGVLKAITDAKGVPLAASGDNVEIDPKQGSKVVTTLDISMQQQLEDILKAGLKNARSDSGSALIMDPNSGAIKAMANYPTYNPAEFYKAKDANIFNNESVSSPLEVGSVMKPLTAAAALDKGSVKKNQSYYDPSFFKVDGETVTNIEEDGGAGTRTVSDILTLSLNTGATWLLMQMGGGNINEKARSTWYDYMTNHYRFGKATGVEQGYEQPGSIPKPNDGFGLNIQYANTSFGQGMSATPLQMGAALSSVINGGKYYRPRLVDQVITDEGKVSQQRPQILNQNVVSSKTSNETKELMEAVIKKNYLVYGMKSLRPNYSVGGKTGTAQISKPEGGYYEDRFNGMFMGFVGGNKVEYVIIIRVNSPNIAGYAGSKAAGPIFAATSDMLIDNFAVQPKSR